MRCDIIPCSDPSAASVARQVADHPSHRLAPVQVAALKQPGRSYKPATDASRLICCGDHIIASVYDERRGARPSMALYGSAGFHDAGEAVTTGSRHVDGRKEDVPMGGVG